MAVITLWLSVYPPEATLGGGGDLYFKILNTPYAPRTADTVHILYDADEGEWNVSTEVKHIYWDGDGTVHAELVPYQIDPVDLRSLGAGYRTAWRSAEGDLKAMLANSGWRPYRPV